MLGRRRRGGLIGTVARTAVVAGTATATVGAVSRHQQQKAADNQAEADQQAEEQAPPAEEPPPAPVYQAPPPPVYQAAAPAPAPAAQEDLVGKINQLAQLRDAGVLSDEEFSAAKGKLLGM